MKTKRCSTCKQDIDITFFNKKQYACKQCCSEYSKKHYRANREAVLHRSAERWKRIRKGPPKPTLEEIFWNKTTKTETCWIWSGYCKPDGYGLISKFLAHRFSWELHNGPLKTGEWVLHKCDNRPCVNPDHLFVGNHADNTADQVSKDRHVFGSKNGRAKLDESKVRDIHSLLASGTLSVADIAKLYEVCSSTVYAIKVGTSWRRVWKDLKENNNGQHKTS